ncbi:hypothetical protein RRG08_045175 [Elysia crispata]|uniref:Uncharacterized protein n=1 Tax=Elysia crispata TaxID=231223 RepID=A0AAE1ADU1_9GAST|nr:hypothetical protein RRG08_045175 [Elysia crispata]
MHCFADVRYIMQLSTSHINQYFLNAHLNSKPLSVSTIVSVYANSSTPLLVYLASSQLKKLSSLISTDTAPTRRGQSEVKPGIQLLSVLVQTSKLVILF